MRHHERPVEPGWRFRLHEIVFEADTAGGKLFDVLLLTSIVASVAAVMLESVPSIRARHGAVLPVGRRSSSFSRRSSRSPW